MAGEDFRLINKPAIQNVPANAVTIIDDGVTVYKLTWQRLLELVAVVLQSNGSVAFADLTDVLFDLAGNDGKILAVHAPSGGVPGIKVIDPMTVDAALTAAGLNAVQGKVIFEALAGKSDNGHGHPISEIANLQQILEDLANNGSPFDPAQYYTIPETNTAIQENAEFGAFTPGVAMQGWWGFVTSTIQAALRFLGAKVSALETSLANYYTKGETDSAIEVQAELADFTTDDATWWGSGIISIRQALLVLKSKIAGFVSSTRTLTINGVTYDLSANRSWTVASSGGTGGGGSGFIITHATIAARDAESGNRTGGQTVKVLDASADPTVNAGYAYYEFESSGVWRKLSEQESMDVEYQSTDLTNYYTKGETDSAIETQAELSDFTTDDTIWWGSGIIQIRAALLLLKAKIMAIRQVPVGIAGQVVGYDAQGNPVAQAAASASDPAREKTVTSLLIGPAISTYNLGMRANKDRCKSVLDFEAGRGGLACALGFTMVSGDEHWFQLKNSGTTAFNVNFQTGSSISLLPSAAATNAIGSTEVWEFHAHHDGTRIVIGSAGGKRTNI